MDLLKNQNERLSAVAVLIDLSTECLILTKRCDHLQHHPGEICFPGGNWEQNDKTLYETALRELDEELGINKSRVTLIKELQIEKTLLGSVIQPWLVSIDSVSPLFLNQNEVSNLISLPLSSVKKIDNYQDIIMEKGGVRFPSCSFLPYEELIWGATARIMKQLTLFTF